MVLKHLTIINKKSEKSKKMEVILKGYNIIMRCDIRDFEELQNVGKKKCCEMTHRYLVL